MAELLTLSERASCERSERDSGGSERRFGSAAAPDRATRLLTRSADALGRSGARGKGYFSHTPTECALPRPRVMQDSLQGGSGSGGAISVIRCGDREPARCSRQPERVLIVEDHKPLRQAIARAARDLGRRGARSRHRPRRPRAAGAAARRGDRRRRAAGRPGASRSWRTRSGCGPAPAVIAMSGQASAEEAFQLARSGARRYLPKPISLEDLTRSVEEALADRPSLDAVRRGARRQHAAARGAGRGARA